MDVEGVGHGAEVVYSDFGDVEGVVEDSDIGVWAIDSGVGDEGWRGGDGCVQGWDVGWEVSGSVDGAPADTLHYFEIEIEDDILLC